MDDNETEKLRTKLLEFLSHCEDEILLEKILKAAKTYDNKND